MCQTAWLLILLCVLPAVAQETVVAVCALQPTGGVALDPAVARGFSDLFLSSLADEPGLVLVERERLQTVVNEQGLQAGHADPAQAVRLGQLVQADVLVLGTVRGEAAALVLTLHAVRVSDGVVMWGGVAQGGPERVLAEAAPLAQALVQATRTATPAAAGAQLQPSDRVRRQERAAARRAQGDHAGAAGVELEMLGLDAADTAARERFLLDVAAAGLPDVAAAEIRARGLASEARFAALLAAPVTAATPVAPRDSLAVEGVRLVLAELERRGATDPRAADDAVVARFTLATSLAAEGREASATAAYITAVTSLMEGLRTRPRAWLLAGRFGRQEYDSISGIGRRIDPLATMPRLTVLPPELAVQFGVVLAAGNWSQGGFLHRDLAVALVRAKSAGVRGNAGAPCSPLRLLAIPTQVRPLPDANRRAMVLAQPAATPLPEGTVILNVHLGSTVPAGEQQMESGPIGQAWDPATANRLDARTGVPWRSGPGQVQPGDPGRSGPPQTDDGWSNWMDQPPEPERWLRVLRGTGSDAHGLWFYVNSFEEWTALQTDLRVSVAMPGGAPAGTDHPVAILGRVAAAYLDGQTAAARDQWAGVRSQFKAFDAVHEAFAALLDPPAVQP